MVFYNVTAVGAGPSGVVNGIEICVLDWTTGDPIAKLPMSAFNVHVLTVKAKIVANTFHEHQAGIYVMNLDWSGGGVSFTSGFHTVAVIVNKPHTQDGGRTVAFIATH